MEAQQLHTQPSCGIPRHMSGSYPRLISCSAFAAKNFVKAESVRSRVCKFGSYFGIVPEKLANGRLAFPDVQVTR